MQTIKTQADFKFPYLIMKYLNDCSLRKDIGYLPYGMILMPFFQKAKIMVDEEMQIIMLNATTIITISNLYKIHLTLGDGKHQVGAHIAPTYPTYTLIVGNGFTTQTPVGASGGMIVV